MLNDAELLVSFCLIKIIIVLDKNGQKLDHQAQFGAGYALHMGDFSNFLNDFSKKLVQRG